MPILHQHQLIDKTPQHLQHQSTSNSMSNIWSTKINGHTDAAAESSNNFVSVAHPNRGKSHSNLNYENKNCFYDRLFTTFKGSHKEIYDPYKVYTQLQKPVQKKPWIHELLQKEVTKPTPTPQTTSNINTIYHHSLPSDIETTTHFEPTISPSSMTTTNDEPLFPQYKKPTKSTPEQMYLIIQGHSKVKTYGQTDDNNNNGKPFAKIVPIENIENPVIKHVVSEDEKGVKLEVKHLHKIITHNDGKKNDGKNLIEDNSKNTMGSLLSLLDTTFGDYFRDGSAGNDADNDDNGKTQKLISMTNVDKLNELELNINLKKDDDKHVMKLIRNKVE